MTAIAELEGQLQLELDRALLAVYADALQQRGDLRGAWIALDLRCEADPTLRGARDAALRTWLGRAASPEQAWDLGAFRLGFLDDVEVIGARTAELLVASPAGRYVRGVTLRADAAGIENALRVLVRGPLPWLVRVTIDHEGGGLIDAGVLATLAGMAPNLEELDVRGKRALLSPLPVVSRLRLEAGALVGSARLPGVVELDLAFPGASTAEMREAAAMITAARFPDVRHLDLARNEPTSPSYTLTQDVLPLVEALPARARFASLRLPALRTIGQRAAVLATLDALPEVRIEIARGYRAFDDIVVGLAHPRLRLPASWAWPPPEQRSSREALRVIMPGATPDDEDTLALTQMAWLIERTPARWSAAAMASWQVLWTAIAGLAPQGPDGASTTVPFAAATLVTALDELRGLDRRCAAVAARLQALPPDAEVALARYWGW